MMLGEVGRGAENFVSELRQSGLTGLEAVYLVGGAALNDFSERQSNIDLVVVWEESLSADRAERVHKAARSLRRAGRDAELWNTTWLEIAEGPGPASSGTVSPIATLMTRSLLRSDAIALTGPDWPVVWYDGPAFRRWCVDALGGLVHDSRGPMLIRNGVAQTVLQGARLAQGALTGRVFSKVEAGDTVLPLVPSHFRRILADAVGFRQGAKTSMYWGPFERKYDARVLLRHLTEAAADAP